MKYESSRKAALILGVHPNTLRRMADDGDIETIRISGQRKYNVEAYLGSVKSAIVCYCRVSGYKQKDDLARQVSFMQERYPEVELTKDLLNILHVLSCRMHGLLVAQATSNSA